MGYPIPPFEWPHVGRQWPPYNIESGQADGLEAWWSALAQAGTKRYTDLIRRISFTENGTPEWITDPEMRPGLDFDSAASEYLEASIPSGLVDIPCTIAVWCRLNLARVTSYNNHTVFCISDPDIGFGRGVRLTSDTRGAGNMRFSYNVSGTACSTPADIPMAWNTLTLIVGVSYTQTDHRLFVQGIEEGAINNNLGIPGLDSMAIGVNNFNAGYTHYFNGAVIETRAYNRAFTASEVWQLYDPTTRWELPQIPRRLWRLVPTAVKRIPRYGFTNFQIPGIV